MAAIIWTDRRMFMAIRSCDDNRTHRVALNSATVDGV
jgi:hypothetical protein